MAHRIHSPRAPLAPHPGLIWSGCLPEQPRCAVPGCARAARAIDPFFPYLDDGNRCEAHGAAPRAAPPRSRHRRGCAQGMAGISR